MLFLNQFGFGKIIPREDEVSLSSSPFFFTDILETVQALPTLVTL